MDASPMEDKRKKTIKMVGWSIILFIIYIILLRVFVSMTADILDFVFLAPSTRSPWEGPDPRKIEDIVKEKVGRIENPQILRIV